MIDVLSIGNANVDLIIKSDKLVSMKPVVLPGGSACNFAVGCARLGLRAGFLGFTGSDEFSKVISEALKNEGVKSFIKKTVKQTGFVLVFTKNRFKKFIKYPGANELLKTLNLKPYFNKARHLHLGTPPIELLKQLPAGLSVSVDPGASISKHSLNELKLYLKNIKYFLPNEGEARLITGLDYKRAALAFLDAGVEVVVIKLGRGGCYLATKGVGLKLKSIDLPTVDTTGAGDAFDSAFISAVLKGESLSEACKWGIISSNVCVGKLGAQTSATTKELSELYQRYYA